MTKDPKFLKYHSERGQYCVSFILEAKKAINRVIEEGIDLYKVIETLRKNIKKLEHKCAEDIWFKEREFEDRYKILEKKWIAEAPEFMLIKEGREKKIQEWHRVSGELQKIWKKFEEKYDGISSDSVIRRQERLEDRQYEEELLFFKGERAYHRYLRYIEKQEGVFFEYKAKTLEETKEVYSQKINKIYKQIRILKAKLEDHDRQVESRIAELQSRTDWQKAIHKENSSVIAPASGDGFDLDSSDSDFVYSVKSCEPFVPGQNLPPLTLLVGHNLRSRDTCYHADYPNFCEILEMSNRAPQVQSVLQNPANESDYDSETSDVHSVESDEVCRGTESSKSFARSPSFVSSTDYVFKDFDLMSSHSGSTVLESNSSQHLPDAVTDLELTFEHETYLKLLRKSGRSLSCSVVF